MDEKTKLPQLDKCILETMDYLEQTAAAVPYDDAPRSSSQAARRHAVATTEPSTSKGMNNPSAGLVTINNPATESARDRTAADLALVEPLVYRPNTKLPEIARYMGQNAALRLIDIAAATANGQDATV